MYVKLGPFIKKNKKKKKEKEKKKGNKTYLSLGITIWLNFKNVL